MLITIINILSKESEPKLLDGVRGYNRGTKEQVWAILLLLRKKTDEAACTILLPNTIVMWDNLGIREGRETSGYRKGLESHSACMQRRTLPLRDSCGMAAPASEDFLW
jgi:hypothetical protein